MKAKLIWALASVILLLGMLVIAGCTQQQSKPAADTSQTGQPSQAQQPQASSGAKAYAVAIEGFAFNPAELNIKQGDAVTWTNKDSAPHTITSDTGTEINSPSLSTGQTYSHTFSQAGTFTYHCSVHPSMKATVVVS